MAQPEIIQDDFAAGMVRSVRLYPTPGTDDAGGAITARIASQPTGLDTTTNTTPIVDDDFHESLVDGAIAVGKRRINRDLEAAQVGDQVFDQAIEEYRRRVNGRGRSGPQQIRVRGFHF